MSDPDDQDDYASELIDWMVGIKVATGMVNGWTEDAIKQCPLPELIEFYEHLVALTTKAKLLGCLYTDTAQEFIRLCEHRMYNLNHEVQPPSTILTAYL